MSFLERFFQQGWKALEGHREQTLQVRIYSIYPGLTLQISICMTGWYCMYLRTSSRSCRTFNPMSPPIPSVTGNTMQHHATPPSFWCEDTFFVVVQYVFVWCPIFVSLYPHSYCSSHPYSRKCACPIISLWYPPANPSMAKKEKSCLPIQKLLRFHQSKFLLWGIYHQNILNSIQVSFFGPLQYIRGWDPLFSNNK